MIQTTFSGTTVRLVTEAPEWGRGVSARISVPSTRVRGLTGREARAALGGTLRVGMEWEAVVWDDAIDELRNALQVDGADGDIPFVVPFWPAMVPGAEAASAAVGSEGLWVGWDEDGANWTISASAGGVAARDWAAPGLWGRLQIRMGPEDSPVAARAYFVFTEDGAAGMALAPETVTWTEGPALPDATRPKVWPFPSVWARQPTAGTAEVEVERRDLGHARIAGSAYWPQNAERPVTAGVRLVGIEIPRFLRWWLDRRANVDPHFAPTLLEVGSLAAGAAAGATTLALTDGSRLGANRYLLLGDGIREEWVRISTLVDNTATLTAPLDESWTAGGTSLSLMMLARHTRDEVEIEWATPAVAEVKVDWRELPAELTVAAGESRGSTLGSLGEVAWLYEFTVDRGGLVTTHRLTAHERDLVASGQTWTSWAIEHGEIRQSLRLDRDEVVLKLRYRAPMDLFLPGRMDGVLRLAIFWCAVSGSSGSSVVQVFGGEATRCSADGPFCSVSFAGLNAIFSRRVPRYLMQRGCNYTVFDGRCGLVLADWDLTAVVQAVSGATVTLETFTPSGSVPVGWGGAHWFALGYLERASGARSLIIESGALDGSGRVLLTLLAAPATAFSVGESVTVVPGCDGDAATCSAKFNNLARFGGFPFLPDKNPSFQPLKKSDSVSGKK